MSSIFERLYQEIGGKALALADELAGKLLVYAEVEDGVISADIFYVHAEGNVRFRFCPKDMKDLIYMLWERWGKESDSRQWRVMCYIIDGGRFSVDLIYPDQLDEKEELSDRRPRAIKQYFGDVKVDYSKP